MTDKIDYGSSEHVYAHEAGAPLTDIAEATRGVGNILRQGHFHGIVDGDDATER